MDDPRPVRSHERLADPDRDREQLRQWQRTPAQPSLQCFAVQILHHQEVVGREAADVVNAADVRVIQGGDRAGFAFETETRLRIFGLVAARHLDGHRPAKAGVSGAIHLAHATSAKVADDLVRAKHGSRGECHVRKRE